MIRKFFPHDKNYLLEAAQLRLQDRLLSDLVEKAKAAYERHNNPLGLNDSFSERIRSSYPRDLGPLLSFYQNLAGIYRFRFGQNQLDFLWDGRAHEEKYEEDWSNAFQDWTSKLCCQTNFVQAVLDLTVFLPAHQQIDMVENRMNAVMLGLFEVRIHKQKGIQELKVNRA